MKPILLRLLQVILYVPALILAFSGMIISVPLSVVTYIIWGISYPDLVMMSFDLTIETVADII